MSLSAGTRLGPYEILSALGAGGMGEVYRARDTKLNRDVALKVLPETFIGDSQRLARFRREAQVLASLNHPNIAAIHGLEESNGVPALVLELVDGPTLADRIARGPLAADEALPIAKQIVDALEAAHAKGIIHRDLKPANIKMTSEGRVKILDFGIAKLAAADAASADLTGLATASLTMTRDGVLLGTPAYMSPEQARGQSVDKRTDIWAFGCLLYEMLTGRAAFTGNTVSDTIAAILERDPDWTRLPPATPQSVRRLLLRSLEKDCKRRLADISDARLDVDDSITALSSTGSKPLTPASRRSASRVAIASAVVLAVGIIPGLALWRAIGGTAPRVSRMTIAPPNGQTLSANTADRFIAIAPDGAHLAFLVFRGPQSNRLLVKAMDQLEPTEFKGLGDTLRGPFFSPDGAWIGFFDVVGLLKKVSVTGGPAVTVCRFDGAPRGATWGADGTIIFATSDTSTGLWQVSASGGEPKLLTKPNADRGERDHLWPRVLPDGRAVLFTIMPTTGGVENAQVAILDLRSGTQKTLVRHGSDAQYVATGQLVYGLSGELQAVSFDPNRLEALGTPTPVVPQVVTTASGANAFDVAGDGTLVYLSGKVATAAARTLVWVDRHGKEEPLGAPPRTYVHPRVSPDGDRVLVESQDDVYDIWLWDSRRKTLTRVTTDPEADGRPLWAPDGQRMFFTSMRSSGVFNPFMQVVEGTGPAERLIESPTHEYPTSISADGTKIVLTDLMKSEVKILSLDDGHATSPPQTLFAGRNGEISPDGRWVAYESNESGQSEVYVRPFPAVNSGRWQVSNTGGTRPRWARDSHELFYVAPPGALMTVGVGKATAFTPGEPIKLLEGRYYYGAPPVLGPNYDVSPDGRFLMIKPEGEAPSSPSVVIVQNWTEELRQRVPTK